MTAERLREAATVLRTAAEATDGDWYSAKAWATASPFSLPIEPADAALIAVMGPSFALAVADWLDATATEHETPDSGNPLVDEFFTAFNTAPDLAAVTVADAVLGGESR